MVAVTPDDLDDLRRRRPQNGRFYVRILAFHQAEQAVFEREQAFQYLLLDLARRGQHRKRADRRTAQRLARFHFAFIEFFVVLPRCGQNDRMESDCRSG